MRIHFLSDLHVEFKPFDPPETNADVVILVGDVHVKRKGLEWAKEKFKHIHVTSDYWLGGTRVICNPKGYPDEINTTFQPDLVIDV